MNTIIGKVSFITETEKLTASFSKRIVGVYVEGYKPQIFPLEFVNDKMQLLNSIKVGDDVRIHYVLGSHKWTNQKGKENYAVYLRAQQVDNLTAAFKNNQPIAQPIASEDTKSELPEVPEKAIDDLLTNL